MFFFLLDFNSFKLSKLEVKILLRFKSRLNCFTFDIYFFHSHVILIVFFIHYFNLYDEKMEMLTSERRKRKKVLTLVFV